MVVPASSEEGKTILRRSQSIEDASFPSEAAASKTKRKAPRTTGLYLSSLRYSAKDEQLPVTMRSESMAYPSTGSTSVMGKISYYLRFHSRAILATAAFIGFVVTLSSDSFHDSAGGPGGLRIVRPGNAPNFGGAIHPGYFKVEDSVVNEHTFRFAAVTDLDQLSKVDDSRKPFFRSVLLPGTITREASGKYKLNFEETRELTSFHNEAGRGMELSELTIYQNRLLSFDDRTGTVFEILNKNSGKESYAVPRFVITEGEGDTDKGMKWEWATVKNNELYMGSMGKEYTNADGSVANTNNLWIAVLNAYGELRRLDWTDHFNFVRKHLGAASPGYIINEAVLWSDHLQKWVFLPRRVSSEMYDEVKDERKGSNKLVLVDDKFTTAQVVDIEMADIDPLHGFSSFAFVPGTKDRHAMAIRSVEEDCTDDIKLCKQRSYFMVFDVLTGEVLLDEVQYEADLKFEGIEFVDIYTKEPRSLRTG